MNSDSHSEPSFDALQADVLSGLVDMAMSATQQPADDDVVQELAVPDERYERGGVIGEGGLKTILSTEDRSTGRQVALAVPKGKDADADRIEAFLREARITANLQHPNIVPVYDIGMGGDGVPFFTMKLITGDSLADILKALDKQKSRYVNRYGLPERVEIFLEICRAVAYAHSRGVLHLDLKPSNVRVGEFGEVQVCDWGMAKVLDEICDDPYVERYSFDSHERRHLTLSGHVKGTPGYMAPEQAGAFGNRKDRRTDVYALGAMLYELLALRLPVTTKTVDRALDATRQGRLRPLPSTVPEGLQAVVLKALARSPDARYESVDALMEEVSAWTHGFATGAEDAGAGRQAALFYKRNKRMCHATAAFVAALLIVTVSFIVRLSSSEQGARRALAQYQAEYDERVRLEGQAAPLLLERAQTALYSGDLAEALTLANDVISIAPENDAAHNIRGMALLLMGRPSEASASFRNETEALHRRFAVVSRRMAADGESVIADNQLAGLLEYISLSRPSGTLTCFESWVSTASPENVSMIVEILQNWTDAGDIDRLLRIAEGVDAASKKRILLQAIALGVSLSAGEFEAIAPSLLKSVDDDEVRDAILRRLRGSLAIGGRVTSTSPSGDALAALVDGDKSSASRWRTTHLPTSILIDIGAARRVNAVAVYTNQSLPPYTVGLSLDGQSFTTAGRRERVYNPRYAVPDVVRMAPELCRYVRLTFSSRSSVSALELREIEVFDGQANLALARSAVGRTTKAGFPAALALNGRAPGNEYWEGNPWPASLTVDLESSQRIAETRTHLYYDGRRHYQYTISVSTDGKTFTRVVDRSSNEQVAAHAPNIDRFTPVEARFVKLTMLRNSANEGTHVREFEVFPAAGAGDDLSGRP
jgi:tRNA A-37 threonylcarbamoyl transferase component Bud32/tetratricopeptide (TPR) repeat protein